MVQTSISKTSRHVLIPDEQSCNSLAIHDPYVNPCAVVPGYFINKRNATRLEILSKPSSFLRHTHALFEGWTKKEHKMCWDRNKLEQRENLIFEVSNNTEVKL